MTEPSHTEPLPPTAEQRIAELELRVEELQKAWDRERQKCELLNEMIDKLINKMTGK